jgi:hypothetical protein
VHIGLQIQLVFWGLIAVALVVWPRHPYLAAAAWGLILPAELIVMWPYPGPIPLGLSLLFCVFIVRALDAAASNRRLSRGAYLGYVLYLVLVPRREQPHAPPPRSEVLWRIPRGLIILGIAVGLTRLGRHVEPWRIHPYLDDVWFTLEMAIAYTGIVDIAYAPVCLLGIRAPSPHDPTFFLATSVCSFWTRWNTMFGGVLRRAVFRPLGGRHHLALAVLATFAVSGLVHCLPLMPTGVNRTQAAVVMGSCLLFFLLHGVAILLEGALPVRVRRRVGRALLIGVWAVTIPLYPGMLSAFCSRHRRPPEDMTILHVVPGLRGVVGTFERPSREPRRSAGSEESLEAKAMPHSQEPG